MARYNHWVYALISKDDDIREIQVAKDGLLVRAPYELFADLLTKHPTDGNETWFFNDTRDREIANLNRGYVIANPQLVWSKGFEITS